MAAALLQYQACLGIMVRLQVEDLTLLKQDFDRMGRGLTLHEFVSAMLDRVSWEPENVVAFIQDLVELFAQVDVNGDGSMEWEEFTSAIIEGGMGTSCEETEWRDLQYEENPRFADLVNRQPPKRVQLVPEFRRLLLYENSRPVVEIIDPSTLYSSEASSGGGDSTSGAAGSAGAGTAGGGGFSDADNCDNSNGGNANGDAGATLFTPTLSIVNQFHPLCYIAGYRRDQDEVRSERSPVQALKYLSHVELLAVSAGDLKLTFWATSILTASSASALETPVPLTVVHTPRPQRVLEWNAPTQHLFSISADLLISVWHIERESKARDSKGRCEVTLVATLKKHTDLLQDLLVLNAETLVSCGMDSMIYLWDTQSLQPRAVRQGHRRGVRLLTKLSNQLFLSAGFECDVLGWDISALATTPVFKLWGHTSPVCCIQLIASASFTSAHERRMAQATASSSSAATAAAATAMLADQAITVDDDGWFKWWNLATVLSAESSELEKSNSRCLQTFRVGNDKYPWRAHSLAVLNNGQCILAAGLHKLKLLQRVRRKPKVLESSVVLFNNVSFTLLTTTDKELRIWDAASGTLIRTYSSIATSEITCVDFDTRQRKVVFGTQSGELVVLNYLNGAVLKTWAPHQLQVSALLYCKEDQCVLTASWDRSLRLYDDNASANALLRCITDAHDADIKSLAYCYALSLVATGASDGSIKLWDYIYFLLEDVCSSLDGTTATGGGGGGARAMSGSSATPAPNVATHASVAADVNALEFIEPYPLLLSGHENGMVCIWGLASTHKPTTLLVCFHPLLASPPPSLSLSSECVETSMPPTTHTSSISSDGTKSARDGGVSCCQVFFDEQGGEVLTSDIRRGRFLLLSGSSHGDVCVSDISPIIAQSFVRAFREESLPSSHARSYNPRRRFLRQGKNAKRLKGRHAGDSGAGGDAHTHIHTHSNNSGDGAAADDLAAHPQHAHHQIDAEIQCVAKWRAHQGNIRCLRTVDEPRAILTCASDKRVRVWSFDGECLGDVTRNGGGGATTASSAAAHTNTHTHTATSSSMAPTWRWEIDLESTARAKREQAEAIWDAMKASKLRSAAARHQSVVELSRRRRRSTALGLASSASAPALQSNRPAATATATVVADPSLLSSGRHTQSDTSVRLADSEEQPPSLPLSSPHESVSDATRLFAQLRGEATWKQSEFQVARQQAWENERAKFQQRMKKIMKAKAHASASRSSSVDEYGQPLHASGSSGSSGSSGADVLGNQVSHSVGGDASARSECERDTLSGGDTGGDAALTSDEMLLPAFESSMQQLPFSDKDNWGVGSLNREKQMYNNLHHENVRRSLKAVSSLRKGGNRGAAGARAGACEQIDLAPSPFLLEKLGTSCVVLENLPSKQSQTPHPRRAVPLARSSSNNNNNNSSKRSLTSSGISRHAQSTSALASHALRPETTDECAVVSSSSNSNDSSAPMATHHSMQQLLQQYDALLQHQVDEEEQLCCTSNLLTSTASLRALSSPTRRDSQGHMLSPLQPQSRQDQGQQQQHQSEGSHGNDGGGSDTDTAHKPLKKVSSAPSNRQRFVSSGAAAAGGRPISSAKVRRHAPHGRAPKSLAAGAKDEQNAGGGETAAAKKQRMRADAALLRQDHFGLHSRDDIVNIYRTFRSLDKDQSGTITLRELRDGVGLFAGSSLQDNIMSIFSSIDKDQSGHIDLPELLTAIFGGGSGVGGGSSDAPPRVLQDIFRFCRLLESAERAKKAKKRQLSPEQLKELYALFKLYDLDRDGNIDVDELFSALQYNEKFYDSSSRRSSSSSNATQITREDVQKIIARFDVNTNATLDMDEFVELFRDDS